MNPKTLKTLSFLTVVLFAVLTVFFAWHARNFEIDASAETLLTEGNEKFIITQQAAQRYNPDEFILIAFKPKEASIFAPGTLNRVNQIAQQVAEIERVESVLSIANVPIFTGIGEISPNIDPDQLTWLVKNYSEAWLEKNLTRHPIYEDLLFNGEQTALGIQVVFKQNSELADIDAEITNIRSNLLQRDLTSQEQGTVAELSARQSAINKELQEKRIEEIETIRSMLVPHEEHGEFFLGGGNLLAYQLIQIIQNDLVVFGALIVAIISLVLFYLFRQFRWVFLPLLSCAVCIVITLGLLTLLGLKVTVISANVVALQIILTLAVIIHIVVQYQELQVEGYKDQHALVLATIKRKVKPCFYAGITTAIGFGSLIFSGVQPVISFGWMMVIAMMVTLVVSLVLFPAMLISFLHVKSHVQQHRFVAGIMSGCASLVEKRPWLIVSASLLLTVVGVLGSSRLTAENSFLNYFSKSTEVYRELSFIDREFGGSTPFDVLYNVPEEQQNPELALTAAAIQTVTDIQKKLEQHEAIGSITSLADFTLVAKTVAGKPLTEYELTALYRALDEDLRKSLFGSYFSQNDDQIRISTRVQDSRQGFDRAQLIKDIHSDMEDLGIAEDNYELTNLFVLYQDILSRLVKSQFVTLGIVYLAMALVLWVIFSSIKVALIALVPNIITTASVMGAMGLLGIPLDLMTLTIAAVAMGISVDDTIHYVHRYLEENQRGRGDAVRTTNLSVGYALIYTTLIIVLGFASLVLSDFVPSILFGLLTSAAMVVALLTDITILPVLLRRFISKPAT